ncbi:MAG: hypothetical protein Q9193_000854 [Seirophora villosa]
MLPESSGLLPYWLLMVVAFSILNTIQCYKSAHFARRTFNGPSSEAEVTPFASRLFGSWSFLSALIRLYAAYHIHDAHLYFLALCTYLIVLAHFAGELLVYGTMKVGGGLAPPLFVASTSVVWMLTQWSFYVD